VYFSRLGAPGPSAWKFEHDHGHRGQKFAFEYSSVCSPGLELRFILLAFSNVYPWQSDCSSHWKTLERDLSLRKLESKHFRRRVVKNFIYSLFHTPINHSQKETKPRSNQNQSHKQPRSRNNKWSHFAIWRLLLDVRPFNTLHYTSQFETMRDGVRENLPSDPGRRPATPQSKPNWEAGRLSSELFFERRGFSCRNCEIESSIYMLAILWNNELCGEHLRLQLSWSCDEVVLKLWCGVWVMKRRFIFPRKLEQVIVLSSRETIFRSPTKSPANTFWEFIKALATSERLSWWS